MLRQLVTTGGFEVLYRQPSAVRAKFTRRWSHTMQSVVYSSTHAVTTAVEREPGRVDFKRDLNLAMLRENHALFQ